MKDRSFRALSSHRLTVRRFQAEDAGAFAAYRSDPDVARYQGWQAPYSLARAARLIESLQDADPGDAGEGFQFAVALTSTGLLIGDCYLRATAAMPREAELGFTFARAYQGKGYALEAVQCLMEYAFTSLALQRVFAVTQEANRAARRLLDRTGFRSAGILAGEPTDPLGPPNELTFELFQEDWRLRQAP